MYRCNQKSMCASSYNCNGLMATGTLDVIHIFLLPTPLSVISIIKGRHIISQLNLFNIYIHVYIYIYMT